SRPPPSFTLLPYTTLFRSYLLRTGRQRQVCRQELADSVLRRDLPRGLGQGLGRRKVPVREKLVEAITVDENLNPRDRFIVCGKRSEEHTSELQSRVDLVCR